MPDTLTHLINGQSVGGDAAGESVNPSNLDEVVARYPKGSAEDVNEAVKAARAAFPAWSEASPEVRLARIIGMAIPESREGGHETR